MVTVVTMQRGEQEIKPLYEDERRRRAEKRGDSQRIGRGRRMTEGRVVKSGRGVQYLPVRGAR